jgi:hypothetical protein
LSHIRELQPPSRIVRTFVWDGMPEDEAVEKLELIEHDGRFRI